MAIRKTTKGKGRNFRSTDEGAGMTSKGVKAYRKANPGSKLKTAVTKCDVKVGTKAYKRQKAFCSRSKSWDGERGRAARKRWCCSRFKLNIMESKGLGDTIAKFTKATGIKRLADSIPGGCGCKNRQNILNDYFPYKNK